MKTIFHTNTLNYRGTTVAITDYAHYAQEILGKESVIAYNKSLGYEKDSGSEPAVIEALSKRFEVIGYESTDLLDYIDCNDIELAYFIKAGVRDNQYPMVHQGSFPCRSVVHTVFQANQPHGDVYAYISEWLARTMSNNTIPYVPHIVQLPEPTGDFRSSLGISKDKIVIGRYGGLSTFDIPFVHQCISRFVESHTNYVFIFVGTTPFITHPDVMFFKELHDLQLKANFINTCDAMIHARLQGESFGLAIGEFLSLGKPVIAWNGGYDKHHIDVLEGSETLYNDAEHLMHILTNIKDINQDWRRRVEQFTPASVMIKFNDVFYKNTTC